MGRCGKTSTQGRQTESYLIANKKVIFDMQSCLPNREPNRLRQSPEPCHSIGLEVLFIGRNATVHVYTDEVLKRAGFQVHMMTPWEAKNTFDDGIPIYPLVIFSNTIHKQEAIELGKQLRRQSPASKLLLILGPDAAPVNLSMFDSVLEGLDGPAALVRETRRLAASSKWQSTPVTPADRFA